MYPTSVLLRKGHRIRVALAGAHASLFEQSSCGTRSLNRALAAVVLTPAASNTSFMATGTPMQRSPPHTSLQLRLSLMGFQQCRFCSYRDKSVEQRVERLYNEPGTLGLPRREDSLLFQQSCDLMVQTGDSTAAVVPAAFGIEAVSAHMCCASPSTCRARKRCSKKGSS